MGKFRKKPVEIEAVQWPYNAEPHEPVPWMGEPPQWFKEAMLAGVILCHEVHDSDWLHLTVKSLEGGMLARPGDWIIRGVKGELYPCKPDIFAATYDQV